jgi:hypothetical protein
LSVAWEFVGLTVFLAGGFAAGVLLITPIRAWATASISRVRAL